MLGLIINNVTPMERYGYYHYYYYRQGEETGKKGKTRDYFDRLKPGNRSGSHKESASPAP